MSGAGDILATGADTTRWNRLTLSGWTDPSPSLPPDARGMYPRPSGAYGGVGTRLEPETVDASVRPMICAEDAEEYAGDPPRAEGGVLRALERAGDIHRSDPCIPPLPAFACPVRPLLDEKCDPFLSSASDAAAARSSVTTPQSK